MGNAMKESSNLVASCIELGVFDRENQRPCEKLEDGGQDCIAFKYKKPINLLLPRPEGI